jgi:hypothetical protein
MDWLDSLLLPLYEITGDPASAFYVGTFLLALIAAVIGESTIVGLYLGNSSLFQRLHAELSETHILSIDAIERDDKIAYDTHHRRANTAFTKTGALQMALMIGSLWPVFFAAAFLNAQFGDVQYPLPLFGWQIHYIFIFFTFYGLARLVLHPAKYLIPGMHRLKDSLNDARAKAKELDSLLTDDS